MKYATAIHNLSATLASVAASFQRTNTSAQQLMLDNAPFWLRQTDIAVQDYHNVNFCLRIAQLASETVVPTAEYAVAKINERQEDFKLCSSLRQAMEVSGLDLELLPVVNMVYHHAQNSKQRSSFDNKEEEPILIGASNDPEKRCVGIVIGVENMVVLFQIMPPAIQ